jgi:hypothetical protein
MAAVVVFAYFYLKRAQRRSVSTTDSASLSSSTPTRSAESSVDDRSSDGGPVA